MASEQLLSSILEIERHNELLNIFFDSLLKDLYELFIRNESSSNVYESEIKFENLKICQDYPQENLPNLISLKHYNYHSLNLINSDWKKAHRFDIPLLCNTIEHKIIDMPPPFVVLKIDGLQLRKYLNDAPIINESFKNIKIVFELNDRHKIKVCKYKKNGYYYIVMFFDSLNYNESHIFSNHDVIININSYDVIEDPNKKMDIWDWFENKLNKLFGF